MDRTEVETIVKCSEVHRVSNFLAFMARLFHKSRVLRPVHTA